MRRPSLTAATFLQLSLCSLFLALSPAQASPKNASLLQAKVVIAHRGAPGYLPEHTLEGVAMAHSWGVDYIEPDVVLTKDNIPVVLHDITLDTTTNVGDLFPGRSRSDHQYYAIDFTWEEIQRLSAHERTDEVSGERVFPHRFPLGPKFFRVSALSDYLDLILGLNKSSGRKVGIYLELKQPDFHRQEGKDIVALVMKMLEEKGLLQENAGLIFECFDADTLKRLKNEYKVRVPLIQLVSSGTDDEGLLTAEGLKKIAEYAQGIGPDISRLFKGQENAQRPLSTSPLVQLAHENNLAVHAYTVREETIPRPLAANLEDYHALLFDELGVDGVFTDFGDKTMSFLHGPRSLPRRAAFTEGHSPLKME